MFIYFPEFLFKTFKLYVNNSFPKVSTEKVEAVIKSEIMSEKYSKLIDEFKLHKIKLPTIKLEHCTSIKVTSFLGVNSSYSSIDNAINICTNHINDYEEIPAILNKELIYAYDHSIKYKNKNMTLNNNACSTIRSCR